MYMVFGGGLIGVLIVYKFVLVNMVRWIPCCFFDYDI
jgi:hypothetical protein